MYSTSLLRISSTGFDDNNHLLRKFVDNFVPEGSDTPVIVVAYIPDETAVILNQQGGDILLEKSQ